MSRGAPPGSGGQLASILLQGPDERLGVAGEVLEDVQPTSQRVERHRCPGLDLLEEGQDLLPRVRLPGHRGVQAVEQDGGDGRGAVGLPIETVAERAGRQGRRRGRGQGLRRERDDPLRTSAVGQDELLGLEIDHGPALLVLGDDAHLDDPRRDARRRRPPEAAGAWPEGRPRQGRATRRHPTARCSTETKSTPSLPASWPHAGLGFEEREAGGDPYRPQRSVTRRVISPRARRVLAQAEGVEHLVDERVRLGALAERPEARAADEDRRPARGEGGGPRGGTAVRPAGDLALAEDEAGQVGVRRRGAQPLPERPALAVREVVEDPLAARLPQPARGQMRGAQDVEGGGLPRRRSWGNRAQPLLPGRWTPILREAFRRC